jgi:hypothetical protein
MPTISQDDAAENSKRTVHERIVAGGVEQRRAALHGHQSPSVIARTASVVAAL